MVTREQLLGWDERVRTYWIIYYFYDRRVNQKDIFFFVNHAEQH